MDKITFLGLNHSYISIVSEIAEDLLHVKKFDIIKNLTETTGENKLRNKFYEYKIQLFSEVHDLSYNNKKFVFGVTIKRSSTIGNHCNIGSFVTINPGVTIAGEVTIGKGTTIGAGATIMNNINIGDNCTIGAGSVVTKDIPSGWIAYGVPCKTIRKA